MTHAGNEHLLAVGGVGISSIVLAELWYGVSRSERKKQNREAPADFLDYAVVLDWPIHAADEYRRIRAHLTERGTPIGAMDLLIATHARAGNATLVTDNLREFKRVPGLKVENWIKR